MSAEPIELASIHSSLLPGDVIDGRYRIEEVLGAGGMAAVYRATHLGLGHVVAIKIASKVLSSLPGMAKRFLQEARAATQLKTEHIAHVHDVGTLPSGIPYMVMEYLEGRDLKTVLEDEGPLPVVDAVDYVIQCCEALAEVHGHGMVHRDIKPANLFLLRGSDGLPFVKLIDFGIARADSAPESSRLTSPQVVMGSPPYMAPEQIQAASDADERSDIWGLGVVLYELLTGAMPFEGGSLVELLLAQTTLHPTRPSERRRDIPSAIDGIIAGCLAPDPSERIANVAELASALARFGGPNGHWRAANVARTLSATTGRNEPVSGITKRVRPPMRSNARLKVAASVVACALLGASAAWLWSPSTLAQSKEVSQAEMTNAELAPSHLAPAAVVVEEPPAVAPTAVEVAPQRIPASASNPAPAPQRHAPSEPSEQNLFEYRN